MSSEEERKLALPEGFVYLDKGPLKKGHFEEKGDNLLIWLEFKRHWKIIDCQGSTQAYYAARENSQAHLSNV